MVFSCNIDVDPKGVCTMEKQQVVTERSIVIKVLKKYRKIRYLWDPTHKLYTNKNARNKGIEILLKTWLQLEPNATIETLKKKISHWRAAYRRERNKVAESMKTATEPDEIHSPNLWYYKYLTFINEDFSGYQRNSDSENNEISSLLTDNDDDEDNHEMCEEFVSSQDNEDDDNDSEEYYEEPKKPRRSAKRKSHDRTIKMEFNSQQEIAEPAQVLIQSSNSNDECSADLFGRSLASQLKEVSKFQRCLAEKLISEIMFYAKLDQLNLASSINLQSTDT